MASQTNTRTLFFSALALVLIAAVAWFFLFANQSPEPVAGVDQTNGEALQEGVHYRTLKSPIANSETKTPDSKSLCWSFSGMDVRTANPLNHV